MVILPHAAAGARIEVRAPSELTALARAVEGAAPAALAGAVALTGPDPTSVPIVVDVVPEEAPLARRTPPWISGFANGSAGWVVLFPARVPGYPDRALPELLTHELTHVLVHRVARGYGVPRWFDEGVAMAAARESDLGDRARLTVAALSDDSLPLARLDRAFAGGESAQKVAYALARDVMRELVERHGREAPAAILDRVGRGVPFRVAFREATGIGLVEFEMGYWERRTFWDRWLPIVTSSALLWGGISLLAIAAFRRRRARDAERYLRWEEEEQARAALAALRSGSDIDAEGEAEIEEEEDHGREERPSSDLVN